MTNIRASGFDSKSDLEQRLDEIEMESAADVNRAAEFQHDREAELEISWLRKEVSALRETLRMASGETEIQRRVQGAGMGRIAAGVIPITVCLLAFAFVRSRQRALL